MTNEKAVEMWRKYPNSKRIRNIAFKAIIKNNHGIICAGWVETLYMLRSYKITDPHSHKDSYHSFFYEMTRNGMNKGYDRSRGYFFNYYKWLSRSSIRKYLAEAYKNQQRDRSLRFDEVEEEVYISKGEVMKKTVRSSNAPKVKSLNHICPYTKQEAINSLVAKSEEKDNSIGFYVTKLMGVMTPKEKILITRKYGIGDHKEHTLDELGDMHNISGERVRQIIDKAKKRIRKRIKNRTQFSETFVTELKENYLTKY